MIEVSGSGPLTNGSGFPKNATLDQTMDEEIDAMSGNKKSATCFIKKN
jgi:hypothetical protein